MSQSSEIAKKIENEQSHLSRLSESNIIGVIFCTVDTGLILEANEYFLNMMGYSKEKVIGVKSWAELTPPGEYEEVDRCAFKELISTGRTQPFYKDYVTASTFHLLDYNSILAGERIPVLVCGAIAPTGRDYIAYVLDLSAQKRAEEAKKNFLASVSHGTFCPKFSYLLQKFGHL
jgi:PAS domain S-box-containing protein